jgi:bisphosphoglycerate-independent phosphoglycerate mutase (AlkP superfamily)
MDLEAAIAEIELLDEFLGSLFSMVDLKQDIIIITSDHGNIEDISVKTHTYNKVPVVIAGKLPAGFKPEIHSLLDIMPAVLDIFSLQ